MAMRKVFISYARDDRHAAEMIAARLEKAGASVFVDADSLVSGGTWSDHLGKALLESTAVVVLLSSNARKSHWVESEVQAALENKKIVIPVLLDDDAKENWLWPLLANRQSFALDAGGPAVTRQLDLIAGAIGNDAQRPARASRRWALALVATVILLLGFAAALWPRAAQQARLAREVQLERDRRIAAEAEQARVARELQDKIRRQDEAERLVAEGAQLASNGRLSEAIRRYSDAIQLNGDSIVAHQLLGYAYLRRAQLKRNSQPTDLENAVQSLERAVALDPRYVWASYNLALAYWEAGRQHDAITAVRRVLEIDPAFRVIIADDGQFAKFRQSQEFRTLLRGQ
jgi:tetratricopeptide (TPR) repeat protein